MAMLDKRALVEYMITKHRHEFAENISPIKLQKGLYFLFAFWGGDVRKHKNKEVESEIDFSTYDENLFEASFEAWSYGPVDKTIYKWYKYASSNEINSIERDSLNCDYTITAYIDNLIGRIFISNDFGLVDLSHEDNSWRSAYSGKYTNEIDSESIISEYATR